MKYIKKLLICLVMILILISVTIIGNSITKSENKTQGKQKEVLTSVQMEKWAKPDEDDLKYYELGEFVTKLPVLYINTEGQQIMKNHKTWGNIALLEKKEEGQSVMSLPDKLYPATIKHRGASSYSGFEKKQYRIEFFKTKSGKEKKISIDGMMPHSEWVLNGPYLDKSMMRNKLVYDLARELGDWAPDSRFVEVFLDGKYQGVYLAVEPVTNGEGRLRLSKFGLLSGKTAYILDRNRLDTETDELVTYGKAHGYTYNGLYISYPSKKRITERQRAYIENDISQFEKSLYEEDLSEGRYRNYIDMDNWVDYFIINEFAMNHDAGNLSTYIYKELDGKLQLAVWDFNNGFDNYRWFEKKITEFSTVNNSWFDYICKDRIFIEKVIKRYEELRKSILSEEHINTLLNSYEEEIFEAARRDSKVWWNSQRNKFLISRSNGEKRDVKSFEEAVEKLKGTIHGRLDFMDENLDTLYENCK